MNLNQCLFGDNREILPALVKEGVKVQCCVTSPPYYKLRSYDHDKQIGQEKTPQDYLDELVGVFRHVYELLADNGLLWVNLADSYTGVSQGGSYRPENHFGLGPKQLMCLPWRFAIAMQQEGWLLRSDIIWHRLNCTPESVRDRCTRNHEYIFMFAKNRYYYFDVGAIQEESLHPGVKVNPAKISQKIAGAYGTPRGNVFQNAIEVGALKRKRTVWSFPSNSAGASTQSDGETYHGAVFPPRLPETCILASTAEGDTVLDPFMGSGTTAVVARQLGRKWLGVELNASYKKGQDLRINSAFQQKKLLTA